MTPTETRVPSTVAIDRSNDLDCKVSGHDPDTEMLYTRNEPSQIACDVQEPEEIAKARHAILAALPLPSEIPDDSLKPILIPSPFTLHEFLGNASGVSGHL